MKLQAACLLARSETSAPPPEPPELRHPVQALFGSDIAERHAVVPDLVGFTPAVARVGIRVGDAQPDQRGLSQLGAPSGTLSRVARHQDVSYAAALPRPPR